MIKLVTNKKYLNISEVSKMLQIEEHKIRYWDSIDPKTHKYRVEGISTKSKGGTRYFNKENIKKLKILLLSTVCPLFVRNLTALI